MSGFYHRLWALLRKEWIQMWRDPLTLRLILVLPLLQLVLYGFAINSNPKNLPTGILSAGYSKYERTLIAAMQNTGYFDVRTLHSEKEGEDGLVQGKLLFVMNIPANFDRLIDRGDTPSVLMDADATDPSAVGNAMAALGTLTNSLTRDLPPTGQAQIRGPPFQFQIHARYNPEQLTVLNVLPGLICLVLIFSTLFLTTLSIAKERERGTMENLLATPVRPVEMMIAKIVPYVFIGYAQVVLILVVSTLMFALPIRGSLVLLMLALGLFIISNLALGLTFSSIASNQMQAQQMAQFTLMPSFILSGFFFPFSGMPAWAQWIGEMLPTTHIIRVVRGILLKGSSFDQIINDLWPIALFALAAIFVSVSFYRETLD
ncbi:MAG: ABC transporter permease [Hyphomicrobiales bacterium]|nr:ABC transporter permease [Hyphomicrobiales bacterium]MDE2115447.1 ABC transporter permease [Hyphomicrobiales bacterium]